MNYPRNDDPDLLAPLAPLAPLAAWTAVERRSRGSRPHGGAGKPRDAAGENR